jgi:hypothetical protein
MLPWVTNFLFVHRQLVGLGGKQISQSRGFCILAYMTTQDTNTDYMQTSCRDSDIVTITKR